MKQQFLAMIDKKILSYDKKLFPGSYGNEKVALQELRSEVEKMDSGWISVKDRLPEHGKEVIAFYTNEYRKGRTLKAQYLYKGKEESDSDSSGEPYDEYIEEEDKYTYVEGWYECNEIEDGQYYIGSEITHWQPLPPPPFNNPI